MSKTKTTSGCSAVLSTDGLCVGDKVKLLKSIWDDGEDHHPPGWIAQRGEIVIVREIWHAGTLAVAHAKTPGSFLIYEGEYETHNVKLTGRPLAGCLVERNDMQQTED